jgi:serine/threonine protein kinase
MEAFPSALVFGPYLLHAKIAQGGMSSVFLATSTQKELAGQFIAIKKLLPHLNSNKPFVNLLIHEAKTGVLLNHPCIASVFDLGSYQSEFFLAMEYVHGKSLDRILDLVGAGKFPPLGLELSSYIVLETLRALAFAHDLKDIKNRELNIVHRDVTPGNILVSYAGEVKLADFGIATAENRLQPGFTQTAMGKSSYISPEQAVNDPTIRASDIYSLGVVYHQMLTGQLPYQGGSATEIFRKVLEGKIDEKSSSSIPPVLRNILLRCLNRSAKERPQSAPELYNLVQDFFKTELNTDFTSRANRTYYQKKLAEYMKSVFKGEIAEEIELTKKALAAPEPEELPAELVIPVEEAQTSAFGAEATLFQADFANEATRNYPFDEEPSRPITQNPRVAVKTEEIEPPQTVEAIVQEETQPEFKITNSDLGFEFETVASGKHISVEDKLRISHLSRDEKENLKGLRPQLEISTAAQLEAFEAKTFSGGPTKPATQMSITRAETRMDGAFNAEKTKPRAEIKATKEPPKKRRALLKVRKPILKPLIQKYLLRLQALSPHFTKLFRASEKLFKYLFITAAMTVVFSAIWLGTMKYLGPKEPWKGSLKTEQIVTLEFVGEVPQQDLVATCENLKDPASTPNLLEVEQLFSREFKRYTNSNLKIIHFDPSNYPSSIFDALTKQPNLSELLSSDLIFSFLKPKTAEAPLKTNASTIYIYFYPFDGLNTLGGLPDEFAGEHHRREGAVFAAAHPSQKLRTLLALAREVAKIYGATEKVDPITHMPQVPTGLANPKERPLYPQSRAELMGKYIPTSPIQKKSVSSLAEVIIGPATAFELGWINPATRDRLLK